MILLITGQIFQLHYKLYRISTTTVGPNIFVTGGWSMVSIIKQINLTNMPVKQLVTQEAEFAP